VLPVDTYPAILIAAIKTPIARYSHLPFLIEVSMEFLGKVGTLVSLESVNFMVGASKDSVSELLKSLST
jgi:hypothetical protein